MMTVKSRVLGWGLIVGIVWGVGCVPSGEAAKISDFLKLSPYAEMETRYDDNVFELSEEAALPANGNEREDIVIAARAGLGANLEVERPYLTLGASLNYDFEYARFIENDDLDSTQNKLDFDFKFGSNYEEGLLRDRLSVKLSNNLSLIPIDEEEPLLEGNRTLRNIFQIGAEYKLIATRRVTCAVGYAYGRTDYPMDDPIEVMTVQGYDDSSDLTQESQTQTGKADLKYLLNRNLTALISYTYDSTAREENPGELFSATFTRQHVLGGFEARFTPKIHGNLRGGYAMTSYRDVQGVAQDDQDSFVAETSITGNFNHQPLMTVGYRKYFTENDFGDTLLTDVVTANMGFKIVQGLIINFSSSYIREERDLFDDEAVQKLFGVDTEYEIVKNMSLVARYNYRQKDFFARNFGGLTEREETSQAISGGVQYKLGRYWLLKAMYSYTEKTSDLPDQEFTRNQVFVNGRVLF